MNTPLLHNKSTIIYGAGGGIGAGVALEFARQCARLFLAGRTREPLERMLGGVPRPEQVAQSIAFLASDRAAWITATILNVTCGLVPGP